MIVVVAADVAIFVKYRGRNNEGISATWNQQSGVFSWGKGEITLPAGFTYKAERGMDTVMGNFTSPDTLLVLSHDIGEYAGEHGGMGRSDTLRNGSRVRIGHVTRIDEAGVEMYFHKVSFPDSGCANFAFESPRSQDAAIMETIVRSFRPTGWKPSWLRPLLPEILRSDCRYRFEMPWNSR